MLAVVLAGCQTVSEILPFGVPPGGRELIVTVTNGSPRPATLMVGSDEMAGMPQAVGTANPATIAAGATVQVRFGVPAGTGWAIFVNPGPDHGPLVLAGDVPPNASGAMPFTIGVDSTGNTYAQVDRDPGPGWFGE